MAIRTPVILFLLSLASCQDAGTYAAQCAAPLTHWRKQSEGMNHHAIPVHVRMDAKGDINWNGVPVTDSKLANYLDQSRPMDPLPFVILSADENAPCNRVKAVRSLMDQRYCNLRWVCGEGSGKSADWNQVMDLPPPEELERLEAIADNAAKAANKQ